MSFADIKARAEALPRGELIALSHGYLEQAVLDRMELVAMVEELRSHVQALIVALDAELPEGLNDPVMTSARAALAKVQS